jgi:hypothetical protein
MSGCGDGANARVVQACRCEAAISPRATQCILTENNIIQEYKLHPKVVKGWRHNRSRTGILRLIRTEDSGHSGEHPSAR